jgi:choline-glycine betaine transporter
MKKLKPWVFYPPFILLLAVIVLHFVNKDAFTQLLTDGYTWVLATFGWLFAVAPFLMLITCVVVYFSPFGRVIIGGPDAKPLLSKWRWFAITLCTTIAIGILFWATAEPITHLSAPPESLGIAPGTAEAAEFAMDTILLHWTCTPYAIYTLTGLMFAFAYYNMKKPFSLGSSLAPLMGKHATGTFGQAIDAICLYCLVAGMAASLGAAMMLIGGGINHVFGIEGKASDVLMGVITLAIVGTFIVSAVTGLMKGIRILSNINTILLIALVFFVLVCGPTKYVLIDGIKSTGRFLAGFVQRNVWTVTTADPWAKSWTIFYWANWFAWAPITAVFLGRISYGHSVRAFIIFNLILPAAFSSFWMVVFGSSAMHLEMFQDAGLIETLKASGEGSMLFAFLAHYPAAGLLIPAFLIAAFISFVTASDSNTSAMGGLCSVGISPESPEPGIPIKIIWGIMIGLLGWVMVTFADLDGIRMLSNLGGLPALLLGVGVTICVIMVACSPKKYDCFKEGYDDDGRPVRKNVGA